MDGSCTHTSRNRAPTVRKGGEACGLLCSWSWSSPSSTASGPPLSPSLGWGTDAKTESILTLMNKIKFFLSLADSTKLNKNKKTLIYHWKTIKNWTYDIKSLLKTMVDISSCARYSLPGNNHGNTTSATWWYNEACLAICGSTGTWEQTKGLQCIRSNNSEFTVKISDIRQKCEAQYVWENTKTY